MKLGISTSSLDDRGYGRWGDSAYRKLSEHGYACSDLNMSDTDTKLYTLPQEEADAILLREKELALKAGIEISQVHGPWRCPVKDSTEEDRKERMEKMKSSIRSAALLGCKNWVIHPIMPFGMEDAENGDEQKTWDMNLVFMRELLKTAKDYAVTICLENMPFGKFSLSKPESILSFVREIGDDHFKICLDTGHVATFSTLSLAEETRRLGSEIRVLHVHDTFPGQDAHMIPYFGVIDWKGFAQALRDIGFSGVFSFETMPPRGLPTPAFEAMCKCLKSIAEEILA